MKRELTKKEKEKVCKLIAEQEPLLEELSCEKKQMKEEITYCPSCKCMTKSIRKGRTHYDCGKCNANKSLSDFYQWELHNKVEISK